MLARFLHFIKKHALFNSSDRLLVAVSGGVDSMVLCELLKQSKFNFAVAHCNFQLRGDDSDGDAFFVKEYALNQEVEYFETSFETVDRAHTDGISIQMAARELRYTWFSELIETHGFDCLLTAHHLNDTAETVLMNLVRGTSIHGVKGIDFKTETLRRPLSIFNKKELTEFAKVNALTWREDVSNADNKYLRNAIRNKVIPQLQELNSGFLNHIEQFTEKNKVVQEVWSRHIAQLRSELVEEYSNGLTLIKSPFLEGRYSAFELFELIVSKGFNYDQAKSIIDGIGHVGAKYLSNNYVLFVEREFLGIKKRETSVHAEVLIGEGDVEVSFGDIKMSLAQKELPIVFEQRSEFFDLAKLTFPLRLRKWRKGDKMKPLGMKGTKLISDILIDKKVDSSKKEDVYVLLSSDEICWLVGFQLSETFSIDKSTQKALKISFEQAD